MQAVNVRACTDHESMTNLAYMVRKDWGQHGTARVSQSAVIRQWAGSAPYVSVVADARKFLTDHPADRETVDNLLGDSSERSIVSIGELARLTREGQRLDQPLLVIHPYDERELDELREAVDASTVARVFVMLWSPVDRVRPWLDGCGALNLHTGRQAQKPDPLMVVAAKMMVDEEYNGLSSGNGKDAVVQLVRAFERQGYALDVNAWLRAYFAAGGSFRHSESVSKLITEIAAGVRHRVKPRYRDNIFEVLSDRAPEAAAGTE
jgi:hypothetical protein